MKNKFFLLFLFAFFGMSAMAQDSQQDYRPFAQDGKKWELQLGLIKENIYGSCMEGDTVINGEDWKKVYNYHGFPEFGLSYYAAVRDVGKKVYAIAKGSTRPRLLYDFSLEEGSTVMCGIEGNAFGCLLEKDEKPDTLLGFPFVSYLKVERIDTITYRDRAYRRFTFSFLDAFHEPLRNGEEVMFGNVSWIEGVGAGAGPFSPWMQLPSRDCILQSCQLNREYLCTDFFCSYEPAVIGGVGRKGVMDNGTYNLQGRRVWQGDKATKLQSNEVTRPQDSSMPKGVYIQNGRKYVVK